MPQTASKIFDDNQRRSVNESVQEAESKTSAEILPVVATSSGRYDRAEDMIGFWLALIVVLTLAVLLPMRDHAAGSWAGFEWGFKLLWMAIGATIAFIVGIVLATQCWPLRRLFTPQRQMRDDVDRAARAAFFDANAHHTQTSSALLIYLSLYERRAVLLADENVMHAIDQATLDQWCQTLTAGMGKNEPINTLCDLIENIGTHLATPLPRADDDINELPDALIVID